MGVTRGAIIKKLCASRPALRRYGVRRLGLFGSVAHGTSRASSDLDFLVEFNRPTFDDYMDLKAFLESRFRRRVDLVLADSLKPRIRPAIMRQVVHVPGL
jgi:hypothetical protein